MFNSRCTVLLELYTLQQFTISIVQMFKIRNYVQIGNVQIGMFKVEMFRFSLEMSRLEMWIGNVKIRLEMFRLQIENVKNDMRIA